MFRALLAHPQEALHNRHLVYCVRVMSVGCTRSGVELDTNIFVGNKEEQVLQHKIAFVMQQL
jgi:hypothetical protein